MHRHRMNLSSEAECSGIRKSLIVPPIEQKSTAIYPCSLFQGIDKQSDMDIATVICLGLGMSDKCSCMQRVSLHPSRQFSTAKP